jgi:GNAT superfamily N-acetyltransferase
MEILTKTIKELIINGHSQDEILKLCDKLYDMTDFICEDYPKHKTWYYQKHLPATLMAGSGRDIVFAYDETNIYGTAFIKEDENEKKICTLFVSEDARGKGVATKLVEKAMEILNTTKPMITLADYKLPMFEGLIKKYKWEKTQEVKGLYNDRSLELVFNGILI